MDQSGCVCRVELSRPPVLFLARHNRGVTPVPSGVDLGAAIGTSNALRGVALRFIAELTLGAFCHAAASNQERFASRSGCCDGMHAALAGGEHHPLFFFLCKVNRCQVAPISHRICVDGIWVGSPGSRNVWAWVGVNLREPISLF